MGPDSLHYRALIDEAALPRKARDPKTWVGRLEHLVEIAGRPDVSLEFLRMLLDDARPLRPKSAV